MRRTLLLAALTLTVTNIISGQSSVQQSGQFNNAGQEIIALSRKFAEEAVLKESLVVKSISSTRPPTITLVKDGEAAPFDMDHIKIKIDANKAVLTSHLIFSGRRADGQRYEHHNSWTVQLTKQGGKWQVIGGQLGNKNKNQK